VFTLAKKIVEFTEKGNSGSISVCPSLWEFGQQQHLMPNILWAEGHRKKKSINNHYITRD